MDDEVRKAAIEAIISKRDALLVERKQLMAELDTLASRLRRNEVGLFDCRSAARLFGTTLLLPDEIGREFYFRRESVPRAPSPPPAPSYHSVVAQPTTVMAKIEPNGTPDQPIRELVLAYLKRARAGAKAADIRAWVEGRLGRELHRKTIGMTLYRLSEKGLTRRKGTTWFFVSPETENPGVGAPGSETAQ